MAFPTEVCFGQPVSGSLRLRNNSNCRGEFRLRLRSDAFGDDIVSNDVEVAPGDSSDLEFRLPEMPDEEFTVEQVAEVKAGTNYVELASRERTISPIFSQFELVSTPYPSFVQPGDTIESEVTIQNAGQCSGSVNVSGTQLSDQEFNLDPGETATFTHRLNMPGEDRPINLDVQNLNRDDQLDSFSDTVQPSQAVLLDTKSGTLNIHGGFPKNINYSGLVVGTDLSGENLESGQDNISSGARTGGFNGTVSTDNAEVDTINFSNVDYLNMQAGTKVQWVVDQEIQGKGETFEFNNLPFNPSTRFDNLPAQNPDITVRGGPIDKVGRLASRLGFSLDMKPNALLRRSSGGE